MNSSSVTSWAADVGNVVVPEGRRASTLGPSGIGEREDTVGNDASELGCGEQGTEVDGTEVEVRCSLFDASIYYI